MKFLRRSWDRFSKLGKGVKKNQKWRRPTGRDNKMREKRRGYPSVVSVGYIKEKGERGKINGRKPIRVMSPEEVEKIKKDEIAVLGKVGRKKKIEIAKKAKEKGIEVSNLNVKRFIKKIEKENKK